MLIIIQDIAFEMSSKDTDSRNNIHSADECQLAKSWLMVALVKKVCSTERASFGLEGEC